MESKKLLLYFIICLVSTGCLGVDFLIPTNPSRKDCLVNREAKNNTGDSNGTDNDTISVEDPVIPHSLYYTAIEYPSSYNWHSDPARGAVNFKLVCYKDGEKITEIPSSQIIKPDPYLHRLIGGHVYAEAQVGSEMVISRDGRIVFRYTGDEIICGCIVSNDDLFTLGQNKDGQGFCLRRNGVSLFESSEGYVYGDFSEASNGSGALYMNNGELCFVYYLPGGEGWYYYNGGLAKEINTNGLISDILGAKIIDGTAVVVGADRYVMGKSLVLLNGEEENILWTNANAEINISFCKILSDGERIYVKVDGYYKGNKISAVFSKDGKQMISSTYSDIISFCFNKKSYSYAVYNDTMKKISSIRIGETEVRKIPSSFLASGFCMAMNDRHTYFALSPNTSETRPMIWDNEEITELDINGYLTNIEIVYQAGQ